jgi:nucleotide-binding universal stress UspA family protein
MFIWLQFFPYYVNMQSSVEAVADDVGDILVPTDGPDSPDGPTDTALDIARRTGATVHTLYVVKAASSMAHFDLVVERREEAGEAAVEAVEARGTELGVSVQKAFRYGTPHEEIHGYAADHGVDLIVIGRREQSRLRRLLGPTSTLELVVRDTDVPVLVATGSHRSAASDPTRAPESAKP